MSEWLKPKGDKSPKQNLKHAFCSLLHVLEGWSISIIHVIFFFLDYIALLYELYGVVPTAAFAIFECFKYCMRFLWLLRNALERHGASRISRTPGESWSMEQKGSKQVGKHLKFETTSLILGSGRRKFVWILYTQCNNPGGHCYWDGDTLNVYESNNKYVCILYSIYVLNFWGR